MPAYLEILLQRCSLFLGPVLLRAELFDFERAGLFGERNELGAAKKEPHPSITRVDKGGLHNTGRDVPSQTFFSFFPRRTGTRAQQNHLQVSLSLLDSAFAPSEQFQVLFSVKSCGCSWCASAQNLSTKQEREGERHRDRGRERGREGEERSPFPLSDAGRFEERT